MAKFVPVKTLEEAQTAYDSKLLHWAGHVSPMSGRVRMSPTQKHGLTMSSHFCQNDMWGILVEEEDES